MTNDEKKRLSFIKRDFNTRNKWTKQDYVDFYYSDVTLLLKLVGKLSLPTKMPEEEEFLIVAGTREEANEYRMRNGLISKNCIYVSNYYILRGILPYTFFIRIGTWREKKDIYVIDKFLEESKAIEVFEEE